MPTINISMTKAELTDAVKEYLEYRGFVTSDRFSVSVSVIPGDRPFDSETTYVTATGVFMKGHDNG